MTTVAIVGIGYWGKNLLRVFADLTDVSVCVHTGNGENAAWIESNYPEVRLTTSYDAVLEDPEIDAVAIATPIDTHYELSEAALEADKHVFVEKPLGRSPAEAEELSELARTRDRVLFVGYIFVHHPTLRPLFSFAEEESVRWGSFTWHKLGDFGEDLRLDLLCHPISILCELFDEPMSDARRRWDLELTGGVDAVDLDVSFPGGGTFNVVVNRVSPQEHRSMHVLFESGDLFYWSEAALYRFSAGRRSFDVVESKTAEPLGEECEAFLSAIDRDAVPRTDGEFGARVNRVLDRL